MKRLLPQSLFGRLMLVLASGLIVAQLLSAAINLAERDSALLRASGMRPVQRIADIVRFLDSSPPAERARIARILDVPPLVLTLDEPAPRADAASAGGPQAAVFAAVLHAALGDDRPMQVTVSDAPKGWQPGAGRGYGAMRGGMMGNAMSDAMVDAMGGAMGDAVSGGGLHRFGFGALALQAKVRLEDGSWVGFDTRITREATFLPWKLLATLVVLLAAVLVMSYVAVRWITRPMDVLAGAADEFGRDIKRPPLPEEGPTEVRRAARAFNTMQERIVRLVEGRTRMLAAMSHDLKTPITRMRLRAELLDDAEARERFERDLVEMEAMVTQTLDVMRGLEGREPEQPVDLMALLEQLRAENEEMGRCVTIEGRATRPVQGAPRLLHRCLANLVDNAILYGREARIEIGEDAGGVTLRVRDRGPGIPETELDAVFEPFYRLEGSRSRETGGTGLGLGIAREIARVHGGEVRLRNHPEGGLEAVLTLPWKRPART